MSGFALNYSFWMSKNDRNYSFWMNKNEDLFGCLLKKSYSSSWNAAEIDGKQVHVLPAWEWMLREKWNIIKKVIYGNISWCDIWQSTVIGWFPCHMVPTLMLFRNGDVLYRESGAMSQADLMDLLDPFI